MEPTLIKKLAFYLRTIQYRMGRLGLWGMLLILTAIITYFRLNLPQLDQLVEAKAALLKAKQTSQLASTSTPKELQPSADITQFIEQFPLSDNKEDTLKAIITIAKKNNLPLDTGTYHTVTKEAGQVVMYEINLPLRGTYPQIKQWLAQTLSSMPNMALTTLQLKQTTNESNVIEAEVGLTAYFRSETNVR
ncbi:MAG: hypothetical protein CTY14_08790 [Methylotenera sp.]|nr:MAG: hypothetical protein CTY14_08790 [Methylotenera sp.]